MEGLFESEVFRVGDAQFVAGGLRLEADDAGVRLARQGLFGRCEAAALGEGWVFVSRHGVVARSETFLGDLARVGEVTGVDRVQVATRGRLAVVTRAGAIFVTDGRSVAAAGPTRVPARVSAFADEQNGAAALADGGLAVTRDGGASWREVALGSDVAIDVCFDRGALRVRTPRGWSALTPDGRLSPPEQTNPTEARGEIDPARLAALRAALHAQRERAPAPPREAVTLADGTTLRVRGASLERVGRDGAVITTFPLPRDYGCEAHTWGPAAAVTCGRDVYRTTDGEALSLVYSAASRDSRSDRAVRFSDDGLHLVLGQPCAPRVEAEGAPQTVCALLDGIGAWREVALPTGYDEPGAMRGGRILFARCEAGLCRAEVLDVETGSSRAITPAARPDAGDLTLASRPRWTRDGALVAVARRAGADPNGPSWLVRGDPGEALALQPLPSGTVDVAFDDQTRGVAVGSRLGTLARTLDGGRTWEPLPVPLDGTLPDVGYEPAGTRCEPEGCDVEGVFSVRGWGPARATEPRWFSMMPAALAPRVASAPPDTSASPDTSAPSSTRLRCASAGSATQSPWSRGTGEVLPGWWFGGRVRVRRASDDRSAPETLAWVGDGVRPGTATLPERARRRFDRRVLGAGTRGPLLGMDDEFLPAWRGPRATGLSFAGVLWGGRLLGFSGEGALAVPAPDGGVFVVATGYIDGTRLRLGAHVTAAGTLTAPRAVLARDRGYGFARVRGRGALAQLVAGRQVRVTPLDGGPAENLGVLPERLAVCNTPDRDRGAAVIDWNSGEGEALVAVESFRESTLRAEVAFSARGACLRGLVGRVVEADGNVFSLGLRASGSALVGYLDDAQAREPIRCEVQR